MKNESILIGRTLNPDGKPVEGTGILLDINSPTAKLLLAQQTVIISNPVTKEYGAQVLVPNEWGETVIKGLGIIPPQSIGPPEHIHPNYEETFTVVEGSFVFLLNRKPHVIKQGEKMVVKRGITHTFKPADKEKMCSFLLEANPPGKLNEVIRTIWGLALEGKTDSKGKPKGILQGIAIGNELKDDTLIASPPLFVQRFMFMLFGKKAARKGFRGIYDKYTSDSFWKGRVEQINNELT
jgi:quercetin dioxygenase-like cupin family protein